jgi:hypothetical protein
MAALLFVFGIFHSYDDNSPPKTRLTGFLTLLEFIQIAAA